MTKHIFLPLTDLTSVTLQGKHHTWLTNWETEVWEGIENGDTAISECLLGALNEILQKRKIESDWPGILEGYLTDSDGSPLAYSEPYGGRLFKYNQWKQTTVFAIHAHWWIRNLADPSSIDHTFYAQMIIDRIQSSGWVYDPGVSCTGTSTRMKSEMTMSLCMAAEILSAASNLGEYKDRFQSALVSLSPTNFVSAEYFRLAALEQLESTHLMTTNIDELITASRVGKGYCDFSLSAKVDDYMGTAKRTARDQALESPISTLHTLYLAKSLSSELEENVIAVAKDYGRSLHDNPLDIPAFRMRDLEALFGPGVTPLELMAASSLVNISGEAQ